MIDYDSELRRYRDVFRRALDVHERDHVLDIGCGAGQTTRDAAAIASNGMVLGIDTAEEALRHARRLTRAANLRNVSYMCGDASQQLFAAESFDVAISRFGTMFFADPASAFTNIRRALSSTGRLAMMVWQPAHDNAWAVAIHRALLNDESALPQPSSGPSAFALGDTRTVEKILQTSGFVDVAFQDVREPVYYGADVESAFAFVSRFSTVTNVLKLQSGEELARTLERLRNVMIAHCRPDGVWFDSRAWIVTARCG